jgi:tetraacyldisaccharide 4'-kinase
LTLRHAQSRPGRGRGVGAGGAIGVIYGEVARLRRSWYARRNARVRLAAPVISVGNLVVGGSGKTPIVERLARLLLAWGERPAILSRGYARRRHVEGVVVVADGAQVCATVDVSGDEPLMLARSLSGVPVLVSPDRHLAGTLAVRRFGATVMLLDDGFQHLRLARDVDLLVVSTGDLEERVLPSGRLREPLSAARSADALLVYGTADEASCLGETLGVPTAFTVTRRYGALTPLAGTPLTGTRVVAVAGIGQPERFFTAVRNHGFDVLTEHAFRDHHWFTAADVSRMVERARALDADGIVTTAKDAVRLEALLPRGRDTMSWAVLPIEVDVEPRDAFASWLRSRLRREPGSGT